jgi:hypothetical protein
MRSTSDFAASRWVLLAGCGMLAVTFLACATDNPATPSEPAARPTAPHSRWNSP